MQRVVDENITIDAVKFFAFGTLEKIFVTVSERSLTSEAVGFLFFVRSFYEISDGKEMMIRPGEMGCKNKG